MKHFLFILSVTIILTGCVAEDAVRSFDGALRDVCYRGVRCIIYKEGYAGGLSCDFTKTCK